MKYTNEQVFVEGSVYARHLVKKRILKFRLLPYVCVECGNDGNWNGKILTLQLDHINGVCNDNRLSNLRFICPNCHSQTDTYAGKNSAGLRTSEKSKPNFKAEKAISDLKKLESAKSNTSIRFGEWGWKKRFADVIGISPQKVDKWLLRVDSKFKETMGV